MKGAHTFVDEARIEVASGDGGDGLVAFRREKFVPTGGPFGGDGGRGGDVVLVADRNKSTLSEFHHRQKFRAPDGQKGGGSGKTGASGEVLEIRLPVGTVVYGRTIERPSEEDAGEAAPRFEHAIEIDAEAERATEQADSETEEEEEIVDLAVDGQRFVIARGGKGGLGNMRFKTSTRQTPDFALPGRPGVRLKLRLSLKLLADAGLVGFPNAGKSTLLRRLSAAKPKVASYPFTTLTPSLGVVEQGERRFVVADIPGLIEGASEGAGLGHQFLRHVERTRVLVHLLDVGAMLLEGRDLLADYEAIRRELRRYRPELLERREIVVLNKVDLLADDAPVAELLAQLKRRGIEPLRLSGATGEGRDALIRAMLVALDEALAEELRGEQEARES